VEVTPPASRAAATITRIARLPRTRIDQEDDHRRVVTGTKRRSGKAATTYRPSSSMAVPASTIAVPRRVTQASAPTPTMPAAAPVSSARPARSSTTEIRAGASSSSVIQATSAPPASVHDSPQSSCVATSGPNPVTRPVVSIAVPMSAWEATSDHFRLTVSARTPAGTSNTSVTSDCATPTSTGSEADRRASTTRSTLVTSHQPRCGTARHQVHRR
jgi:hypothetical protein